MRAMKKIAKLLLTAGLVGLLGGCNNWLDVKPYDSMTEDQLYSTEIGIQRALNGLYLSLASNDLYALELTCGTVDVLSQRYDITSSEHKYYDVINYRYTEKKSKDIFEKIWKSAYQLISNCNEFMEEVPAHQEVLIPAEYPLYMGEALAIRTFMHFDMFRLFGAAYTATGRGQSAVPYYDHVTDIPAPILTGEQMMTHLLADIDEAIALLAKDPMLEAGLGKGEGFWEQRNFRMNYYAAWALKARMYWYMGEEYNTQAHQIATALLNGTDPANGQGNNFKDLFKAFTELNNEELPTRTRTQDKVYLNELIFALHNMKREELHTSNFGLDLEDKSILWAQTNFITEIYTEELDIRRSGWEIVPTNRGPRRAFVKFQHNEAYTDDPYRYEVQSLFRLGELYLIAAATTNDEPTKRKYLKELRLKRGFTVGNTVGYQNPDDLLDLEWQREFAGEGQYLYFLKRGQVSSIRNNYLNSVTIKYDIPLPESETNNRYN